MSLLTTIDSEPSSLAENRTYGETHWYAGYTASRHEKRVAEHLAQRSVEHYLPLYEVVHRWKDRNARVQLPLFPSYVFIHLALKDRMRTLTIPGVVGLVGHPKPTPLPADEIEAIRNYLSRCLPVEPHPYLTEGKRVRIKAGPLAGLEGFILRRKSACRVVINLELIHRSLVVDVAECDLESTLGSARYSGITPINTALPCSSVLRQGPQMSKNFELPQQQSRQ